MRHRRQQSRVFLAHHHLHGDEPAGSVQESAGKSRGNDLSGWTIYVAIEPTDQARELQSIVESIFLDAKVTINDERLGITVNPYRLLQRVYRAGSELNLYLEEDIVVAPDATAPADWYLRHHQPDWLCFNLLAGVCGSSGMLSDPNYPDLLFTTNGFNSLGFAARRSEWAEYLQPAWAAVVQAEPGAARDLPFGWGWDWAIYGMLANHPDLQCVQPVASRATHLSSNGSLRDTRLEPEGLRSPPAEHI